MKKIFSRQFFRWFQSSTLFGTMLPFLHQLPRWRPPERHGLGEAHVHSFFLESSVIPDFMVLSHVPTMLVSWVWQACSRRGGEGPSGGWSDGLCLQRAQHAISPQFQVLPLSCGNPRWLPQLSMASLVTSSTLIASSCQM